MALRIGLNFPDMGILAKVCLGMMVLLAGCSRSDTLILGRVEAAVGGHTVVVTDCYRISAPQPEKMDDDALRFAPCRDAIVVIRAEELLVNGKSFGRLNEGDAVVVDHGVVSVNPRAAGAASPSKLPLAER